MVWVPVDQLRDYVVWSPPGGALRVRLAAPVIERMSVDVMRGFGVTRRRGTEVGGILLGRVEPGLPTVVLIQNYEEVPCEYAFGPSYLLSDRDLTLFRQAAGRWAPGPGKTEYAVGYYRSHTREGLALDQADADLFSKFFSGDHVVALLIRPYATRTSRASFFLAQDGRLDPNAAADEFPFTAQPGGLEPEFAPLVTPPPPPPPLSPAAPPPPEEAQPEAPPPAPVRKPASPAQKLLVDVLGPRGHVVLDEDDEEDYRAAGVPSFGYPRRPRSRWKRVVAWMAFTAAVFAFGGVLGFQYAGGRTPALVVQGTAPPPPAPNPYAVGLAVERQPSGLLVRWNREAPVVQSSQRGLLLISEKRGTKEVNLGSAELRNGTVIYQNIAPEVTFRLELFLDGNRSFVETALWRAEGEAPAQAKPAARALRPRARGR